jgi:diacylglycerol kinase (ATP)
VEALVVCGGDGLVHLGAQAVAGTGVPLGLIPSGTGNDVARYLGLPRTDPAAAADRIIASQRRTIDLARCGDRYFVTVLAAGFDAIVNERANAMRWPRGQMRYNLATLAELRTFRPIPYVLQLDSGDGAETVQHEAMLVAVGNGPSFGGGLRITEGALLDDGLLDVVVITRMSKPKLVRSYPRLFTGKIDGVAEYVHRRVRSVTVAAPGIVSYADGERFGPLPLTVECAPGALQVIA